MELRSRFAHARSRAARPPIAIPTPRLNCKASSRTRENSDAFSKEMAHRRAPAHARAHDFPPSARRERMRAGKDLSSRCVSARKLRRSSLHSTGGLGVEFFRMKAEEIIEKIRTAIPDAEVVLEDLTGTADHWKAFIVSDAFRGKSLLARQRMINAVLSQELRGPIHALSMDVLTREEVASGPRP